ncbi:unnamed protein product [Caenorhabditis auriculariae]|uniref:C2H2-type domain-containing protein n=1 Tax=Caenorhabditis auriculariae TaxID=2777116 RepID=A0A8S1HCJ5_9PELO|nr:unnamed protein product [Caenorhabditis auriculariae]
MSDDEEGLLRIDENADEDIPTATGYQPASSSSFSKFFSSVASPANTISMTDDTKEEGEIEEENVYTTPNTYRHKTPEARTSGYSSNPSNSQEELSRGQKNSTVGLSEKFRNGESTNSPEDFDTKQSSGRKRKENRTEKGSKNFLEPPSSGRSKRASHQLATMAITACLTDSEENPCKLPVEAIYLPKKAKKDASTNVKLTRGVDTSDISETTSLLEAPPGTTILVELQVVCKAGPNSVFVTLKNEQLTGVLSDGQPPMMAALNRKRTLAPNSVDDSKERSLSAASTSSTPAKGFRAGSQVPTSTKRGAQRNTSLSESRRKLSYATKEEEDDVDVTACDSTSYVKGDLDLMEVDPQTMHLCHYDGCQHRYPSSSELEYHITKNHAKKKLVYESICCQTEESLFDRIDKATDISGLTPVETKEVVKQQATEDFSDLSDSDDNPPNLLKQEQPMKIKPNVVFTKENELKRSSSASSSKTLPPGSSVIGISTGMPSTSGSVPPTLVAAIQPRIGSPLDPPPTIAYSEHRPGPSNPQIGSRVPTSVQSQHVLIGGSPRGAIQSGASPGMFIPTYPYIPQFMPTMPGSSSGMMNVGQGGGVARTPSRDHKIHELKAKEGVMNDKNGGAQRGMSSPAAAPPSTSLAPQNPQQVTQRPQFMGPPLMQQTSANPSNPIMQQLHMQQLHQQMQQQQLAAVNRGFQLGNQPDLIAALQAIQQQQQYGMFPK